MPIALSVRALAFSMLSTLVWVSLCLLIFVSGDNTNDLIFILVLILFFISSFKLWSLVFCSRIAPVEISFWIYHTNILFLPALSQISNQKFYWSSYSAYNSSEFIWAIVIMASGLFVFILGGMKAQGKYSIEFLELTTNSYRRAKDFILNPGAALMFLLIIALLLTLIYILGSGFYTAERMDMVYQVQSLSDFGLFLTLPRAMALATLFFILILIVQKRVNNDKIGYSYIIFLGVALVINGIINYPLSIARFWLFGFVISAVWIVFPLKSYVSRGLFVVGMIVMQFTLFPFYSQLTRGKGGVGDFKLESIRQYMLHGDFDSFQTIMNSLLYIADSGFEYGKNILSVMLFYVPRSIWHDKLYPLGTEAAEFMGYEYTNLSSPVYVELYRDFGVLSLLVGMFIMGYLVRKADNYYNYLVIRKAFGYSVVITSLSAGYIVILLRGSLLGVFPNIITMMFMLLLLLWMSKRNRVKENVVF